MTPEARAWLEAVRDEHIAIELEAIYTFTAAAIESRGPACWASGRCCNFAKTRHLLYVTGLETAYTVARLPAEREHDRSAEALAAAIAQGGCSFQAANLCSVHMIKPLGCRVYFCDRSAQPWQQDLAESMLTRLRSLHDRHAIPYRYGEWRQMLGQFLPAQP